MGERCENNTKLHRDGTSRQQRTLSALLPGYISVDERDAKELLKLIRDLAGEINYVNAKNEIDKTWQGFLDKDRELIEFIEDRYDISTAYQRYIEKKGGETEPHIALLLAFLKLYDTARIDLNQITKKHLEFFYKRVLQLKEKPAEPDRVFLSFEPARHVTRGHLLQKGREVKAGKDESGMPLTYQTERDLVVNHGKAEQVKAIFADVSSPESTFRIYASPIANSSDGLGADIETEDQSWKPFGDAEREEADTGFAIASPLLFLSEGNRTVTLTLSFETSEFAKQQLAKLKKGKHPILKYAFRVLFSGEEEWIVAGDEQNLLEREESVSQEVKQKILDFVNSADAHTITEKVKDDPTRGYSVVRRGYAIGIKVANAIVAKRPFHSLNSLKDVPGLGTDKVDDLIYTFGGKTFATKVDEEKCTLTITRTLDESQPPVTAYSRETLGDPIDTQWPVVKVLLRKKMDSAGYPFKDSIYKTLKELKIEKIGLSVDVDGVRSNIIQNDSGLLDPAKPFMPFGNRPAINSSFYVGNREIFSKKPDKLWVNVNWHDLPEKNFESHYSFGSDKPTPYDRENRSFKTEISILDKRSWNVIADEKNLFSWKGKDEELISERVFALHGEALDKIGLEPGLRELTGFGTDSQRGYLRLRLKGSDFGHKAYAAVYTQQAIKAVDDPATEFPNEPYTPLIDDISIDYKSSIELDFSGSSEESFFHIVPFGVKKPTFNEGKPLLLPRFDSEGNLFIGIKDFEGGQTISLLFKVAEGSADPDFLQQPVYWSYLSGEKWIQFDERDLLSDTTNHLLTSGIITFSVPKNASTQHTLLPEGLVWIRAEVEKDTPAISHLVEVRAQAVEARFVDNENDPEHLAKPLEAETISKFVESNSAIKEITQPYASFGGKMPERPESFYTRVSERLRHKNRAVTIWDYERLILNEFPSVYKVKCLNHTRFKGSLKEYSEIAPGHVSLVVVSDMVNKNAVDPLKPKTSLITLTEIEQFTRGLMADCAELHVRNPLYEEVKVSFNVKFRQGRDGGFYSDLLNSEIKSFLSPWAFETTPDVVFGGKIHKSRILHFIETRDYVGFVTCLKMFHRVPAPDGTIQTTETDEAEASTLASVLGSAPLHKINVLESEACECDDNEVDAFKELETDDCGC